MNFCQKLFLIFIIALVMCVFIPVSHADQATFCDSSGCHTIVVIRDSNGNVVYTSTY